jgi:hypothetical protein
VALQKSLSRLRSPSLLTKEGTDLATDEEGHVLDVKAKELRAAAAAALQKAGPGLFTQLHAIQELHLDAAQMQNCSDDRRLSNK